MTDTQHDLTIRGESVQRIYNWYVNRRFIANRRYQRKLVWSIDEKRSFIDSLIRGFPVPIILLAELPSESGKIFEIIDGMQRLNAVLSFIDGDFDYDKHFFDLNTMVESKSLLDSGKLKQKEPILARNMSEAIASYNLALSVYSYEKSGDVDEIFRRINSNGRYLSRQELRAAGALGNFAQLVRRISSIIRGDVSASDVMPLNEIHKISITNRELNYGIPVEDIFWVQQNVLTKEMVRESRDEEIIADLLIHMSLDEIQPSRGERFDEFFGLVASPRFNEIEAAVLQISPDVLITYFIHVYNELRGILALSDKPFAQLVLSQAVQRVPRYFQVVFLAIYELLVKENKEIKDKNKLVAILEDCGEQMHISAGGGTWAAQEKERNINAIKGLISSCFVLAKAVDPARSSWVTQLETVLRQSYTEQNLYDFKQGFCTLTTSSAFDEQAFDKAICTLTAIANHGPGTKGYVVVGVADTLADAERVNTIHGVNARQFGPFYITGVAHEAPTLNMSLDEYFRFLVQKIDHQPISANLKGHIQHNVRLVRYYDKAVVVFEAEAQAEPCAYKDEYYVRHGASNAALAPSNLTPLFAKFLRHS